METRFLHTFIVVVETSSLAEAARRLNVTPSAVIQRIRAVEDEIGSPLIHRSGHSMRPTAAGLAVLQQARQIWEMARDLKAMAGGDIGVGELRVGIISTAVTGLLPDILVALKRNRPRIELYVLPGTSADLYRQILDEEIDAAILVKPHFTLGKTLGWLALRREPLMVLTPASMPEDDPHLILSREPFIRYDRNHWGGRLADRYLRTLRIRPKDQYELDSLEAISVLVDRKLGVSLVPDWAPPWPAGLSLRKIPLDGAPPRQIGIIWSRTSPRLPLIRAFYEEAIGALDPARHPR